MVAGFDVNELHINSQPVATTLHRAFEHVPDIQLPTELLHVDGFPFEGERRVAGDNKRAADPRQVRGQALGDAIYEIILFGVAAEISERQHYDGQTPHRMRDGRLAASARSSSRPIRDYRI